MATNTETEKVLTARQLRRKIRGMAHNLRLAEHFVEKCQGLERLGQGSEYQTHQAQLHLAKLEGMKEAYESLLRSLEAC